MKALLIALFFTTLLNALETQQLESFSADFIQSITDEHNKTITYSGTVIAKRPDFARWHYTKPIDKELYMYYGVLTIIEPEMEQAVIKKVDESIDLFTIIENAKQRNNNYFEAHYENRKFLLTFTREHLLASIAYQDDLDNHVTIHFTNQQRNIDVNETLFRATIPKEYDIIK